MPARPGASTELNVMVDAWRGSTNAGLRDDALMIALVHERGVAKPEQDARVIALGRELDARRKERCSG